MYYEVDSITLTLGLKAINSYSASCDNWCTVGGNGDVGSARYEAALLPPCLTVRVLSYSNESVFRYSALSGLRAQIQVHRQTVSSALDVISVAQDTQVDYKSMLIVNKNLR